MKKLSLVLAALFAFSAVSFAAHKEAHKKDDAAAETTETKPAPKEKSKTAGKKPAKEMKTCEHDQTPEHDNCKAADSEAK